MLATKRMPLNAISFLRPIKSANTPANSVEMTLPSSTAATMMESWPALMSCPVAASLNVASKYGSAPAMMPTSIP